MADSSSMKRSVSSLKYHVDLESEIGWHRIGIDKHESIQSGLLFLVKLLICYTGTLKVFK